jgi:hypothetical protein
VEDDGSNCAPLAVELAAFNSVGDMGEENASPGFNFTGWRQKFA